MTQPQELRLPIEPFRAWLATAIAKDGIGSLAWRSGVSERVLLRILVENRQWVSLDIVDKCLLDSPVCLEELYPWAA